MVREKVVDCDYRARIYTPSVKLVYCYSDERTNICKYNTEGILWKRPDGHLCRYQHLVCNLVNWQFALECTREHPRIRNSPCTIRAAWSEMTGIHRLRHALWSSFLYNVSTLWLPLFTVDVGADGRRRNPFSLSAASHNNRLGFHYAFRVRILVLFGKHAEKQFTSCALLRASHHVPLDNEFEDLNLEFPLLHPTRKRRKWIYYAVVSYSLR